MIGLLIALAFTGLFVGALGRLLVPGPNPMGILRTILVGLAGSFLGGMVGHFALHFRLRYAYGAGLVLSVLFSALIVYGLSRRRPVRR